MAFIAASSVSIGTGLIANKVNSTNDAYSESMMMPSTKTSIPTEARMDMTNTSTSFTITTSWIDDVSGPPVTHIKYTITGTDAPTTSIVEKISNPAGQEDVCLVDGLPPSSSYDVYAILYINDSTPVADGNPIWEIMYTTDPTPEDIPNSMEMTLSATETTITVATTFIDGLVDTAVSSEYVMTGGTESHTALVGDNSGSLSNGKDSVTFTGLTAGTSYEIIGTITYSKTEIILDKKVLSTTALGTDAPNSMNMVLSATETTITVNTTFIDGLVDTAVSSEYVMIGGTESHTPLVGDNSGSLSNGKDSVTFTGLTAETSYEIVGTIMDTGGVTNTIDQKTISTKPPIPEPEEVTNPKITQNTVTTTDTAIEATTTWTNGSTDIVGKIKYTATLSDGITEVALKTELASVNVTETGTETNTVLIEGTTAAPLTVDTEYIITAELLTAEGLELQRPISIVSTTFSTKAETIKNAKIEVTDMTKTSIEVTTTWMDGIIHKATHIKYVATPITGIATLVGSKEIIDVGTDTTNITGLTLGQTYTITATLQSDLDVNITDGQPPSKTVTIQAAAESMEIVASTIEDTEITITSNWIDGINIPLTSSYTITKVDSEEVGTTIVGETILVPGIDTIPFSDLKAGTEYSIVGSLTFEDTESNFSSTELIVITTGGKLSAGAIVGIVIASLVGVSLLGAGGYWLYNKKVASLNNQLEIEIN